MTDDKSAGGYLEGQLLVAMPGMPDARFERSVIYMCAHNAEGAMGLVINKPIEMLTFDELLEQVGIDSIPAEREIRILFGGPVEVGRGFVLHTADYNQEDTLAMSGGGFAVTASIEILRDIATGGGPRQSLLTLGYAGWGPGQLESEIQSNGWLTVNADPALVFDPDFDNKWQRAIASLGIDPNMLAGEAGRA